jgi:hypothetical protein
MAYHSLVSEQYVLASFEKELRIEQSNRRKSFRRSVFVNSLALVGVAASVYGAVFTMPTWLPILVSTYYRLSL